VSIGKGHEVKVMGIINASPESFFKGSVRTGPQEIASAAREMQEAGAHIIDIGAMSTAPYLDTIISVEEEIRRLKVAIEAVKSACDLAVSVDTPRAQVASAAAGRTKFYRFGRGSEWMHHALPAEPVRDARAGRVRRTRVAALE